MKEVIELIAKSLVDNPDAVQVTEEVNRDEILVKLSVAAEDVGKVIGKSGKIAKSIRAISKVVAIKEDKKAIVEIQ